MALRQNRADPEKVESITLKAKAHFRHVTVVFGLVLSFGLLNPVTTQAQSAQPPEKQEQQEQLLTDAELQNLVAPIALFPDTLLVQIAVAATVPLDVMKANRFLIDNAGRETSELEPEIDAMGWDPSVAVLALAFPQVVGEMATHVDWTDTLGTAMLAQSDDVMAAVQVMRENAINTGALVTGTEQTVVQEEDEIVITPTDPQVVYVPQYDPVTVYQGPSTGDVVGTALITFGVVAIIDSIFDDDDDWNDYWGCRNCGGWNGRPIIRNPNVDIDVDGNVNIGNSIDVNGRPDLGWSPEPNRKDAARDKLATRNRPETLPGALPVSRDDSRQNELRNKLSAQTGTADISRDAATAFAVGTGAALGGGAVSSRLPQVEPGNAKRKADAVNSTFQRPDVKKPAVKSRPKAAARPSVKKPAAIPSRPAANGGAIKKRTSGHRVGAASSHGQRSRAKARRR